MGFNISLLLRMPSVLFRNSISLPNPACYLLHCCSKGIIIVNKKHLETMKKSQCNNPNETIVIIMADKSHNFFGVHLPLVIEMGFKHFEIHESFKISKPMSASNR